MLSKKCITNCSSDVFLLIFSGNCELTGTQLQQFLGMSHLEIRYREGSTAEPMQSTWVGSTTTETPTIYDIESASNMLRFKKAPPKKKGSNVYDFVVVVASMRCIYSVYISLKKSF